MGGEVIRNDLNSEVIKEVDFVLSPDGQRLYMELKGLVDYIYLEAEKLDLPDEHTKDHFYSNLIHLRDALSDKLKEDAGRIGRVLKPDDLYLWHLLKLSGVRPHDMAGFDYKGMVETFIREEAEKMRLLEIRRAGQAQ